MHQSTLPQTSLSTFYSGKRVLVTGCTGFKGSWLAFWLSLMGAEVIGFADSVPTKPSFFEALKINHKLRYVKGDIRDKDAIADLIGSAKPEIVFHLAAQALVRIAYDEPVRTFATNTLGTVHVLEAMRCAKTPMLGVFITSDKAYDNVEWCWGYRETDRLGGDDPYSGSKGAAELAVKSYNASYFSRSDSIVHVAVGRAGNVIGGGDWAESRIVPDAARAWSARKMLSVRSPDATRPWQHVLEPLSGYLALGVSLGAGKNRGEAFNFGPASNTEYSVRSLLDGLVNEWEGSSWSIHSSDQAYPESMLLKLNCDKALHNLSWRSTLDFTETVRFTADWYREFYESRSDISAFTISQITRYIEIARERRISWSL